MKMTKTLIEEYIESFTDDDKRLWQQEDLIYDASELVCKLLEKKGMSKIDLSKKMKLSKSSISRKLDGQRNLTLRTLSDMLFYLGYALELKSIPLEQQGKKETLKVINYTQSVRTQPSRIEYTAIKSENPNTPKASEDGYKLVS